MTTRDLGAEVLDGLDDIRRHRRGELALRTTRLSAPAPPQVIRERLDLSQARFAALMGVSVRTLQDWEQGRRAPSGPAIALLRVAEQFPDVFLSLR